MDFKKVIIALAIAWLCVLLLDKLDMIASELKNIRLIIDGNDGGACQIELQNDIEHEPPLNVAA